MYSQLWKGQSAVSISLLNRFSQLPILVRQFCSEGKKTEWQNPTWEIRMLYDSECPLCMHEVNFLKNRDKGKNKLDFVDIASPNYSPEANQNISYEVAMGRIHGILSDGRVVDGMEVFRRCYGAVGLGWVFAATQNKYIGYVADQVYTFWAKYRMQITGRPGLEVIFEKRRNEGKMCRSQD
eukprot:TRINITY_DN10160_c0_g4_i2.p1 TRINITY_DN10160_c0_g4~~TRINITY_DN10160_c0_g4_i2.p1  ORF type:complete len:181 (-),score=19.44 TRINITY_DN10160_c0_g4_i2:190-732(-)